MPRFDAQLLIFDLDGTLVDSAPDIILTVNALLASRDRPPLPDSQIIQAIGHGLKRTVFQLFPEAHDSPEAHAQLEAEFFNFYEANLLKNTRPYPGAIEFLQDCPSEVKLAIVTNKYVSLAKKLVDHLPLRNIDWVAILGADSLARSKPDPLPLHEVMRITGTQPSRTVMIGDGIPDMQAARSAGTVAIACSFGYTPLAHLLDAGATEVIHSFGELPSALARLGAK